MLFTNNDNPHAGSAQLQVSVTDGDISYNSAIIRAKDTF